MPSSSGSMLNLTRQPHSGPHREEPTTVDDYTSCMTLYTKPLGIHGSIVHAYILGDAGFISPTVVRGGCCRSKHAGKQSSNTQPRKMALIALRSFGET